MTQIDIQRIERLAKLHRVLRIGLVVWFVLFGVVLGERVNPESESGIVLLTLAFVVPLLVFLLGPVILQFKLMRMLNPPAALRRKVLVTSLFGGPFGSSWAARELVDDARRRSQAEQR